MTRNAEGPGPGSPADAAARTSNLADGEGQARLLVDTVLDYAIFGLDVDGRVNSWNAGAAAIKGYRSEEVIGQHFSIFYPAEDIAAGKPDAELIVAAAEGRYEEEGWRVRMDGSRFWASVAITALYDDDGELRGFGKVTRDVTERHLQGERLHRAVGDLAQANDGLRRQAAELAQARDLAKTTQRALGETLERERQVEELQRTTLDSLNLSIVLTDPMGRPVMVNEAARILFPHITPGELPVALPMWTPTGDAVADEDRPAARTVRTGEPLRDVVVVIASPTGERLWLSVNTTPILGHDGSISGVLGSYEDVTGREQIRHDLEAARDEAVAATLAKSTFLATMSHEIRTPLNAVIGMTGLLLDTEVDTQQRDYLEIVRSSSDALLAVINDVLDYSKIESGAVDLECEPFDVRDLVEGAVDLVAAQAAKKNLDVLTDLHVGCPPVLMGDATRFRQVLVNLLSNAVKFTSTGEVMVTAETKQTDDGPLILHVGVADTGIGIPPERMDRLFRSFSQVESSTNRIYGGTGLGLAISARLVEAMGGTIRVESQPGSGSTFSFAIPTARSQHRTAMPGRDLTGSHILIVDDNANNRRILKAQLEGWGATSDCADGADAALGLTGGDRRYDVAILDLNMPDMNGDELAAALHRLPGREQLSLVLLSSESVPPEARRHFVAQLQKPTKAVQLHRTLVDVLGRPVTSPAPSAPVATETPTFNLRVLLVEDNPINQMVAVAMLKQLNSHTDVAANGAEAFAAARRTSYDIILMDVQMPEMDGLEATRRIRSELSADNQPLIVAMTANAMLGDRRDCLAAGMSDYLAKPFKREQLVTALATAVR